MHACVYVCSRVNGIRTLMNVIIEYASGSFCTRLCVVACACTHMYRFVIGIRTPMYVRAESESVPLLRRVCVHVRVCIDLCIHVSNTDVSDEYCN